MGLSGWCLGFALSAGQGEVYLFWGLLYNGANEIAVGGALYQLQTLSESIVEAQPRRLVALRAESVVAAGLGPAN